MMYNIKFVVQLLINLGKKEQNGLRTLLCVRKGSDYKDSSFSEEEQIENLLQTQRMLAQKVDQATGSLQGMIEDGNAEYLPTDNKEDTNVENNIDA
ncbi:hypothetical protein RCL_jg29495.t1 [Rhizophagus clarus]|uniref:Uncharacterized protein n=1 Tax=Rhizophagus clarus TaxID=94130 RepID=A0A8H3QGA5_9GLOM|nr:hypothetical protein RCL_jg29495.t1 [Rhizophagus clarus]